MAEFIAAIDQGTTSTRCMIFDHDGAEVARHQLEHEQILPRAGWVEHNPVEIWERTASALMSVLNATNLSSEDIAALGITNFDSSIRAEHDRATRVDVEDAGSIV